MEGVSPSGSELHWPTNGVNLSASQDLAFPFRACLILDDANSTTASSLRRCKSIDVVEVNDRRRSKRPVRQDKLSEANPHLPSNGTFSFCLLTSVWVFLTRTFGKFVNHSLQFGRWIAHLASSPLRCCALGGSIMLMYGTSPSNLPPNFRALLFTQS
jgi:hypothetical protein